MQAMTDKDHSKSIRSITWDMKMSELLDEMQAMIDNDHSKSIRSITWDMKVS